ncbi:acyltransferase family protein [Microbulbifer spongiae]|uniref:Acyltransferase n=1 Tax=Microbulbifer spongiae TaxID=2944933 RepID=A0ABY9E6G2_9GAMM|nr:acyltransferase [Microbulbifer sp. MI-G]WKD48615.1 acyltransferase [Microbulbifer sp. MI-G]
MNEPVKLKSYFPHLDGLRAIAIAMVVLFHAGVPGFSGGFVGVDIFFVLSGYLVTRSLQREPKLLEFYKKRARRLMPALSLMLMVYLLVFYSIRPNYPHLRDAAIAFFYLSDYAAAYGDIPDYLKHTWSLSVEEQFYLIWPLLFLYLKPKLWHIIFAYVFFSAWRWVQNDWVVTYYSFDTRLSALLLGCALAHWKIKPLATSWLPLILLGLCCFHYYSKDPFFQDWGVMIVEISSALTIIFLPPGWLLNRFLIYFGRISYGIYLWHYPAIRIAQEFNATWPVLLLVGAVIGIGGAMLSYHFLESRFLENGRGKTLVATRKAIL